MPKLPTYDPCDTDLTAVMDDTLRDLLAQTWKHWESAKAMGCDNEQGFSIVVGMALCRGVEYVRRLDELSRRARTEPKSAETAVREALDAGELEP